jgi:hypothetical protein
VRSSGLGVVTPLGWLCASNRDCAEQQRWKEDAGVHGRGVHLSLSSTFSRLKSGWYFGLHSAGIIGASPDDRGGVGSSNTTIVWRCAPIHRTLHSALPGEGAISYRLSAHPSMALPNDKTPTRGIFPACAPAAIGMARALASEVTKKRRRSAPGWWGRRWSGVNVEI